MCYFISVPTRLLHLAATLLLLSSGTAFAEAQVVTPNVLTANLSLGALGADVTLLQKILNRDPDTRVASTGPGSQGNETSYFGALTKVAVIRFQEKYAGEVLAPAGLTRGSGYVGSYTRAKLNVLSVLTTASASAVPTPPVSEPIPTIPTPSAPPAAPKNPNLKNLDTFLSAIDTVSAAQGLPTATLSLIKAQVLKDVATTTDLRASFVKTVQGAAAQSTQDASLSGRVLALLAQPFSYMFGPQSALAASETAFGGPLLYSYFCACSGTWLLTLGPLPPSYAVLLTYQPGSQAYLSYNIPATEWLLGKYSSNGQCQIYIGVGCVSAPSQGMITPTVGSSVI